jgi:MAF protein
MQKIILGSSSPYRAELLDKLGLVYEQCSPDIDETPLPEESPEALVERLSIAKAKEIAKTHDQALIIGSDQVAVIEGKILGKPGNFENAIAQLEFASGKCVTFYTGLTLYNAKNGTTQSVVEPFRVHFRALSSAQIQYYVETEQPLNCAGSFKSEGLGISLFAKLEGDDPNSLIGLPLIKLIEQLENEGIDILQSSSE